MTTNAKTPLDALGFRSILNNLGDGILIFDTEGNLLFDNQMVRSILGEKLVPIRNEGWESLASMIDENKDDDAPAAKEIRAKALREIDPIRFNIHIENAYTPAWASAIHSDDSDTVFLMITIVQPDWTPLIELMKTFRSEASMAIGNTKNHADLIRRLATTRSEDMTADQLGERVLGFSELMSADMYRLQTLLEQLHRLEIIRTGQLIDSVERTRRTFNLLDFVDDFLEDITEKPITDMPGDEDLRDRIDLDIPSNLKVDASRTYLEFILRDVLRNAVMYSDKDTLIKIRAAKTDDGKHVQIDVEDRGYGVREREQDRVFKPFLRARQPQIIAEFGYGLSLYLSKANVEAMNGSISFESEEGEGTTFFIQIPTAPAETSDS